MAAKRLYIIAGEASGDLHGSNLVKALYKSNPDLEIRAWGGDWMEEAGATIAKHYKDLAFMGFLEVLMNLRTILSNLKFCKSDIEKFNPDAIILIDYPGFNMRIAEWAHKKGIKVLYYISPQVWAWKKNRVFKLKKTVDKLYVILPFEKEFYAKYNVDVEFVGHPLLDEIEEYKKTAISLEDFKTKNNLSQKPIIALMPGSRKQEISQMLPKMLSVVNQFPEYQFVIGASISISDEFYEPFLIDERVSFVRSQTYDLFNLAKAGLVTSGTATLEAAIFGMPEVVCYRGSAISVAIARQLINIKFISLVNLIMDKEVVKELVQSDLNTENLVNQLKLILNPVYTQKLEQNYSELRQKLGGSGASEKVASAMLKTLGS
jgi:lipid-A-disaccharide synthase